jgi:Na+/H+ antiporter NhaA
MPRARRPFLSHAVEYSLALPIGAALALLWANTSSASYYRFSHALESPVNHVAMATFFALANAGVPLRQYGVGTWAVLAGLNLGSAAIALLLAKLLRVGRFETAV